MWESIEHILSGPHTISVLMFLGLVIAAAVVLTKTGLLQIHTSAVQIGAADMERDIIRQQLDYAKLHLQGVEGRMEKPEGYDEYRGKYVFEVIYDEYVRWITFNHINKSPAYIKIKQDRLIAIVNHNTVLPSFKTKEFEDYIREDTKELINALIEIRELYAKGGM